MWSRLLFAAILTILGQAGNINAAAVANHPSTQGTRVDLGYATYQGTTASHTVNQFLGMRYAAPPTGNRRFRSPQPPLNETGVLNATEHGPLCYGVGASAGDSITLPFAYSEDCLFIDVYTPTDVTRNQKSGLPVMIWIQGGGFTELFNPDYNGTGLIRAAHGDALVVTFNYRVGPYGFLACEELAKEGNLNIGIQDQRAAISWVQRHIGTFGGDPGRVTLFGTSIGAGSILLHLLAHGGDASHPSAVEWSAGIASAPYLPPIYQVDQMEVHYTALLNATGCNSLDCLRSLPGGKIQAANVAAPFPGQQVPPLFEYGPVVDGTLFQDTPFNLLEQGRFLKDKPMIIGTSDSEGTLFVPQANTTQDINDFMRAQLPNITTASLGSVESLYTDTPSTFPNVTVQVAPLFYRAAAIYGDAFYACSAYTFAERLSKADIPVHLFLDRIRDPVEVAAGFLVPHTWEVQAVWGPAYATDYAALPGADSYNPGKSNAAIVPIVQSYWTSFVRAGGDPNLFRTSDAPFWEQYGSGRLLSLETNSSEMEPVLQTKSGKCSFWSSIKYETNQ